MTSSGKKMPDYPPPPNNNNNNKKKKKNKNKNKNKNNNNDKNKDHHKMAHYRLYRSNAEATFIQSTRMRIFLKTL